MQDPATHLLRQGIELTSATGSGEPVRYDPVHYATVNYETYFFATEEERNDFVRNPLEHCGIVTDPVSEERFEPNELSPVLTYGERSFFFLSEEHLRHFEAAPDSFVLPKFKMIMEEENPMMGG